jgi:hypothetical protein
MKLKEALEIAYGCGLETVYEALANASFRAMNFYPYDKIDCEMKELFEEFEASGIDKEELVVNALKRLSDNKDILDDKNKEKLKRNKVVPQNDIIEVKISEFDESF